MKKRTWTLRVLIGLTLCVIWGNSLLNGEISGDISGGLLEKLIELLPFLRWMPELVLRKLGHFSEFTVLGFLLAAELREQQGYHRFTMPLLLGMLAAHTDETIQAFVPDRGPSVLDVWLDTSGVCTGIAILTACIAAGQLHRNKKGTKL